MKVENNLVLARIRWEGKKALTTNGGGFLFRMVAVLCK